jgi:putative ABC transport system permease protein
MRGRWGIASAVALTLALGIGANIAIFSVVDAVLFEPPPYPEPSRLLTPLHGFFPAGYYQGLAARDRTLRLAAYSGAAHVTLRVAGRPLQVEGSAVSANFFSVLAVPPALGHGFEKGGNRPGQDGVAVISSRLWRRRFGGRGDVLGKVIALAGQDRTIVGVMPSGFQFPSARTDVWFPDRMDPAAPQTYWETYSLQIVGRLRAGASPAQAQREMKLQAAAVAATFPYPVPSNWGTAFPLVTLRTALVGSLQRRFLLLLGAVGLVLLIACANVVNLLLAGIAGRRRELAIRVALGAGRGRIARQLVGETMRITAAGGALGLLMAAGCVPLLVHMLPAGTPHLAAAGLNLPTLLFALVLTLAAGVITGGLPGWRAASSNLELALRSSASPAGAPPGRQRLAAGLLVAEVAIAVVVAVAGGLLTANLIAISHIDPGFAAAHVMTIDIAPSDTFCSEPGRCATFYRQLQARMAALPGVRSAGLTNAVPLGGAVPIAAVIFENHPLVPGNAIPLVWANVVTPGYLRTLGIRLLAGRPIQASDADGAQKVVLVNASLARQLWPGENPIGKTVTSVQSGLVSWTVVGVVADVRELALSGDPTFFRGEVYFPYAQALAAPPVEGSLAPMTLALRTSAPLGAETLRRVITRLDPDLPRSPERSLASLVYANLASPRATTVLFLLFGALALVLQAVGVFGVMWHNVAQRKREFGVRMALGAERKRVLAQVMGRGAALTGGGIALGTGAALGTSRLLSHLLVGTSPADPSAYAAAVALVASVALLACLWPAWRATTVDPLLALRDD